MTTPATSSTRPTFPRPPSRDSAAARGSCVSVLPVLASTSCSCSAEPLGSSDDFHDFLGDLRLTLAVHLERVLLDQIRSIVRCAAHRGHTGAVLRRRGLEQRTVDRN